jgi:radical SAM superfamily enzyme YgiQ (UPF0313 family)
MSWKIKTNLKQRLAAESGSLVTRRGGRLRVCLVYPNRYRIAMSNLGFMAVHALINSSADMLCERAFLPDPDELKEYEQSHTPLLSLESQQPVGDFDVVAFSVSFESDYLNLPQILRLAGLPCYGRERTERHPLVMAGGAALFLNPEPVAEFLDLVGLGEAEVFLTGLLTAIADGISSPRPALLGRLATIPGVYIPSLHTPGDGVTVTRQYLQGLDAAPVATTIRTPETEFGDLHLVELSRGCPRGCRFCAAGYIYLPYRQRSQEAIMEQVDTAIAAKRKVGLVAAAVGDYRGIGELCRHILAGGGSVSVSSLRIDGLDEAMIDVLVASGHKTATLAPEGGSQRLRDLIRKGISEEQILDACQRLVGRDILNLKLYFIIGLPTETDDDIAELLGLVDRIRLLVLERARANRRIGEIILSVNPFIPKPFTPFQWCGMLEQKVLEKRLALLQKGVRRMPNVTLQAESIREAMLQALLSRGDRSLAPFLVKSAELGSWRKGARETGIDVAVLVTRQIPLDEELPWGFITGPGREQLRREYRRAFGGEGP